MGTPISSDPISALPLGTPQPTAWLPFVNQPGGLANPTSRVPLITLLNSGLGCFIPQVTSGQDATAAVVAAAQQAASSAYGGVVLLPPGAFMFSALMQNAFNNVTYVGAGPGSTIFYTTINGAGVFALGGFNAQIIGIGFKATVAQTGGAMVTLTGASPLMSNFEIDAGFVSLSLAGAVTEYTIEDGLMQHEAAAGTGILNSGTSAGPGLLRNLTIIGNGTQGAGINMPNVGDVQLDVCNVIGMGTQLAIEPGAGQIAQSIWARGCYFDNGPGYANQNGVVINAATATSTVQRIEFLNCWTSSQSQSGFLVENTGGGTVNQVGIYAHESFANAVDGLRVTSGVVGLVVQGGTFAGNAGDGINIGANTTDFTIIGAQCGAYAGFGGNGASGIAVQAGASDRYIVSNNRVHGNGLGTVSDGGTGVNKSVTANIGP